MINPYPFLGWLCLVWCPIPLAYSTQAGPIHLQVNPGIIEIRHNRDDLHVEKLWIAMWCLNEQNPPGDYSGCVRLRVGGREHRNEMIEFKAIGKYQIKASPISIEFSANQGEILCIGMKVLFQGFPNEYDYQLYSTPYDRYSILSYCTAERLPEQFVGRPRWDHRRVRTFEEFNRRLSRPIDLKLKRKRSLDVSVSRTQSLNGFVPSILSLINFIENGITRSGHKE